MTLVDVPGYIAFPFTLSHCAGVTPTTVTLDAAEEHVAAVMQVPRTGTLKKIGWRTSTISSPVGYTIKVSVETVADAIGIPVATSNAAKALYAAGSESADITSVTAATVYWTEINGSTGITVTRGDWIAVTVRLTAITSGNIIISAHTSNVLSPTGVTYVYTYLNTTSTAVATTPLFGLEYDTGIIPVAGAIPASLVAGVAYNSGSNPDRRGLKFQLPFGVSLAGVSLPIDQDVDVDAILYDSDEYTVLATATLDKDKRRAATEQGAFTLFPSSVSLSANLNYRVAVLPKDTTNITIRTATFTDDGAVTAISGLDGGANFVYTTFNGAPSAGSHTWTDSITVRPFISLLVDKIDIGGATGPSFGDNLQWE